MQFSSQRPGTSNRDKGDESFDDMLGDFINSPLAHILKFAAQRAANSLGEQGRDVVGSTTGDVKRKESIAKPMNSPRTPPQSSVNSNGANKEMNLVYDRWVDPDYYHFLFEIPGINKEDVKVALVNEGNVAFVNVEAVRKLPTWTKIYGESLYGTVKRSVQIPKDVDLSSIEASINNGILKLTFKRLHGVQHSNYKEIPIL